MTTPIVSCTLCKNTGKTSFTDFCGCTTGIERKEVFEYNQRLLGLVDESAGWITYMHGKLNGYNMAMDEIYKDRK